MADASRGRSVVSPLTLVAARRRPAGAAWPLLSRAMLRALAVVAGHGAPPRDETDAAIRDYRLAGRLLTAEREFETEYVMRQLQEIPLTKTRREDAMRLIEYMPRLTVAGRRREAAKDIRAMRRRYGSKEARRRLRALASQFRRSHLRSIAYELERVFDARDTRGVRGEGRQGS